MDVEKLEAGVETKTILVVDDDTINRGLMTEVLELRGFKPIACSSGEEALEIVKINPPSLILLDIVMDGISGLDVLREIRRSSTAVDLPIIMISGKSEDQSVLESLKEGANDYITKPVNIDIALMRIATQLKMSRLNAESLRLRQIEAVRALITTYNHEINNSLTVALAHVDIAKTKPSLHSITELERVLLAIADTLKRSREASDKLEFEHYAGRASMLKIR